jgi:hypothetical protein
MRDVEFRQIRSFEARQMAGPALKSSLLPTHIPASSATSPNWRRRRIYKKVEAAHRPALRNVLRRSHHAAAEERLPAVLLHCDSMRTDIIEPGTLVTAKEAERRVLILEKSAAVRTFEGHDLARSRALPIGDAFRAGELRRTRPHGHTRANISRRLSRNNDNFRPCIGPFPTHVPPQAACVDHKVYRRKVAHNQIKIEVKRLRSS